MYQFYQSHFQMSHNYIINLLAEVNQINQEVFEDQVDCDLGVFILHSLFTEETIQSWVVLKITEGTFLPKPIY